jgi:hypothetical protein
LTRFFAVRRFVVQERRYKRHGYEESLDREEVVRRLGQEVDDQEVDDQEVQVRTSDLPPVRGSDRR